MATDRSAAQGQLGPDFHQCDEDNIDASREPTAATWRRWELWLIRFRVWRQRRLFQ